MKRLLCLAAALYLALAGAAAQAETFAVFYEGTDETAGYGMLVTEDGEALTPPDTYYNLYRITTDDVPEADALYAVIPLKYEDEASVLTDSEGYHFRSMALMNARGELLTDYIYANLTSDVPGLITFTLENELEGVMTPEGEVRVPAKYVNITPNGEGGWLALRIDGDKLSYEDYYPLVMIDPDGTEHETDLRVQPYSLRDFHEGLCAAWSIEGYGDSSIYLDPQGGILGGLRFEEAGDFCGNYAAISEDDRYGLIDKTGAWVVPPKYDAIRDDVSAEGPLFLARLGASLTAYSAETGEILFEKTFEDADEIYAWLVNPWYIEVSGGDRDRLCDLNCDELFAAEPEESISFYYTRTDGKPDKFVVSGGDWPNTRYALVGLDGTRIETDWYGMYPSLWQDGHGLYSVSQCRIIEDENGEPDVDWRSWRNGVCDENSDIVLDAKYDSIEILSMDRFWVRLGNRMGLIDAEENWYYTIDDYTQLMD